MNKRMFAWPAMGRLTCVMVCAAGLHLPITRLLAADAPATQPATPSTAQPAITPQDLLERGQQSQKLLTMHNARFTLSTELQVKQKKLVLTTVIDGARSHQALILSTPTGQEAEIFSIIQDGQDWYVTDMGKPLGKFRPYEAPLTFPYAYTLLNSGQPQFLTEGNITSIKPGEDDRVSVLMDALPPRQRQSLTDKIALLKPQITALGNDPAAGGLGQKIGTAQMALNRKKQVIVDPQTGLIFNGTNQAFSWQVIKFDPRPQVDPSLFITHDIQWEDYTRDFTKDENLADWLMIGSAPIATVDNIINYENSLECSIANLKSYEVRRPPFRGWATMTGCFSKDRTKIYIPGINEQGMGLHELDLSTGQSRRIGGALLADEVPIMPRLSKDQAQLLVITTTGPLRYQANLIDIKNDTTTPLGKPMDMSFLSWLPDDSGFIFLHRMAPNGRGNKWVTKMDLQGNITQLCQGDSPLLIPGKDQILFRQSDDLWYTCDLDGKNPHPYTDGMRGHNFPTVSPDGSRVFWMKFAEGHMPQPVVQDFGQPNAKDLDLGPGLWGFPAWQ